MTYKTKLEKELQDCRDRFMDADNDLKRQLFERAEEIKVLLSNLCYTCGEEPRKFNQYFCSKECNDAYYPKQRERGQQKDISYMQQRLREMALKKREERFKQQQKLV